MKPYMPHTQQLSYWYTLDKDPENPLDGSSLREYYRHMHNDYELFLFKSGSANYHVENTSYSLQAGNLLIIKPMVYHGIEILSSKPYERYVFNFSKLLLTQAQADILSKADVLYQLKDGHPIEQLFESMHICKEVLSESELQQHLRATLNALIKLLAKEKGNSGHARQGKLDEIIEYIQQHLEQPLDSDMLAKQFFVSKSWIDHSFKKNLGSSPKQYINHKKILYAQSLILAGMPATQAAERCGYKNYTTFYRQYKQYLGREPHSDC